MSGNNDWFPGSGFPSFAQVLKKNLPQQPSSRTVNPPPGFSSSENYKEIDLESNVTQITGNFAGPLFPKAVHTNPRALFPPGKIPQEFIMRYKCGAITPVSALREFVQMQHVQLEFKEVAATGNVKGPYFAFYAVVDGIQYKTGLGQDENDSRSNAAKLALDELLQLDNPEPRTAEASGDSLMESNSWRIIQKRMKKNKRSAPTH